jgi:hypothetical protein
MGSTLVIAKLVVWIYAVGFRAYWQLLPSVDYVDGRAGATASVTCSLCQMGTYLTGSGGHASGYDWEREYLMRTCIGCDWHFLHDSMTKHTVDKTRLLV